MVKGTGLESRRMSSSPQLWHETGWVTLDQSYPLSPRKQAMANHFQNHAKKTAGISPESRKESTMIQRLKRKSELIFCISEYKDTSEK